MTDAYMVSQCGIGVEMTTLNMHPRMHQFHALKYDKYIHTKVIHPWYTVIKLTFDHYA